MQQKIVLIGGPGTGKTSVLNELDSRSFFCMPEISRDVILDAQAQGIEQLFITKPLLFSNMLLQKREKQYLSASKSKEKIVFFDRGIPDIHAYMDYLQTEYPIIFIKKSNQYKYNKIFYFSPWKDIYTKDNERYESFKESVKIDKFLQETYTNLGYSLINVPFGKVKERTNFIINSLSNL